ncbi:MAG: anti-sigma regulatory factor [Tissierellia bacterium]|nr:anti-sigma regulatory factor [Tissierellia bacterium]
MCKDMYKISIPNKPENIALVRLTASFIASKMNFDIEEIEDIRVAVSEACNIQMGNTENLDINFIREEKEFIIKVKTVNLDMKNVNEFAVMIIETLMDKVEFTEDEIIINKIFKED